MAEHGNKLTILVDMDDTIINTLSAWVWWLNLHYMTHVRIEDVTDWDLSLAFPTLTAEEVFEPLYSSSFWETVLPKSDAQYYLQDLMLQGHDVYIVTASHPTTIAYKWKLIESYFPYIDADHFIVTSNKQLIQGDVIVDDAPHNLGGVETSILFDAPHNKNYTAERRAYNWKDVSQIIKTL